MPAPAVRSLKVVDTSTGLGPACAITRGQLGRANDVSEEHHREATLADGHARRGLRAQTLYVAAVAGLGNANAQLAEAAAIMQKLPAEKQALRSVSV